LTPRRATKIHFGIDDLMAATTLPPDLVFEKFYLLPTFRALGFKNISWFPKPRILTWAFHFSPPLISN
jgi:hypothetical protein